MKEIKLYVKIKEEKIIAAALTVAMMVTMSTSIFASEGDGGSSTEYTGSIESVQYDNSDDAFTKTKNINATLDSENYTDDSELLRLGRIYYKELVTYSEYWHDVEANLSVRLSA